MESIISIQVSSCCEARSLGKIFTPSHTSLSTITSLTNPAWALEWKIIGLLTTDVIWGHLSSLPSLVLKWHLQNGFCSFYLPDILLIKCLAQCRTLGTHSYYLLCFHKSFLNKILYLVLLFSCDTESAFNHHDYCQCQFFIVWRII